MLACSAACLVMQYGSNPLVCGSNHAVWPFFGKQLNSTFMRCCLFWVMLCGSNISVCGLNYVVWSILGNPLNSTSTQGHSLSKDFPYYFFSEFRMFVYVVYDSVHGLSWFRIDETESLVVRPKPLEFEDVWSASQVEPLRDKFDVLGEFVFFHAHCFLQRTTRKQRWRVELLVEANYQPQGQ